MTVCTQYRECLLGEVVEGEMQSNDAGQTVQTVWDELPDQYPGVDVDEFVVMPNHVHGLIILIGDVGAIPRGCPDGQAQGPGQARGPAPTGTVAALSLPEVVHRFKSFTTTLYRHGVKNDGWLPFPGRLGQRNYYEHVVRDERALNAIREYIAENPARWAWDTYNPDALGPDSHAAGLWELLQEPSR